MTTQPDFGGVPGPGPGPYSAPPAERGGGRAVGGVFMVIGGLAAGASLALPYFTDSSVTLFASKVASGFGAPKWLGSIPLGIVVAVLAGVLLITGIIAATARTSRAPGIIGLVGTLALGGLAGASFWDVASLAFAPDPGVGAYVAAGAIVIGLIGSIIAISSAGASPRRYQ